jgi:hypothetical protein
VATSTDATDEEEQAIKLKACITLALAALTIPVVPAFGGSHPHMPGAAPVALPAQAGQAAFSAIQELVALLEADPSVDWSRVDFDALRSHLIDMDNVTTGARVRTAEIERGARFVVTGDGAVRDSIRRMVPAHAATADSDGDWRYAAELRPDGAVLTVRADAPQDVARIRGLGFFGLLARGMHHQEHHLRIARGDPAHH